MPFALIAQKKKKSLVFTFLKFHYVDSQLLKKILVILLVLVW